MSILSDGQALKSAIIEIPIDADEYPSSWRELSAPPKSIFAVGDISLLNARKFAVVGSRRTPANALKLGMEICKELSEQFVLVTGTADGGDSAAIEGALAGSGRVICLLAGGFSCLPQGNLQLLERVAERGLILSPCAFETAVLTYSYEHRNKLLAKLSEGVLVLGAGEKSGALITAKYAKTYEKPVFAFPYPPNSSSGSGCNRLIKQGGFLTENATDILSRYGIVVKERKKTVSLSADEEKLYTALKERLEAHTSELTVLSGIPTFKIKAILSSLEIKGLIVSVGGNRYAIV